MNLDLKNKKRLVIKIGSSLLVENGNIKDSWIKSLVKNIVDLQKRGFEIIIVSSGAVALGKKFIKKEADARKSKMEEKQASASIGQILLMSFYRNYFLEHGSNVAQILITLEDCNDRARYLSSKKTISVLLKNNIIPIINENDSIAVDEIKIGDNDRLAARMAQMNSADMLILLSDVDGLYNKNPNLSKDAKLIAKVTNINKEIEKYAGGSSSDVGTGGMKTKIMAAKMLKDSSCETIIAKGIEDNSLADLFGGKKDFTVFYSSKKKNLKSRKKWLAGFLNVKGGVVVNKNAKEALLSRKVSLLPVGVIKIKGSFQEGEVIFIEDELGNNIASGITSYSSNDAKKIIKKRSEQVRELMGKDAKKALIHLDNLVVN